MEPAEKPAQGSNGILSLTIKSKSVLQSAYMPFLKNGGIFFPTDKEYALGEKVFLLLSLLDEPEKIPAAGEVVWITPMGAQGSRTAGVGVHFTAEDDTARKAIESHLAGMLDAETTTHTM